MRVEVTKEDIEHGIRRDCGACPLALAAARALDTPVSVGSSDLYALDCLLITEVYELSEAAKSFVRNFDKGANVRPQTFELVRIK